MFRFNYTNLVKTKGDNYFVISNGQVTELNLNTKGFKEHVSQSRILRGIEDGSSPQLAFSEIRVTKATGGFYFEVDCYDLDQLSEKPISTLCTMLKIDSTHITLEETSWRKFNVRKTANG